MQLSRPWPFTAPGAVALLLAGAFRPSQALAGSLRGRDADKPREDLGLKGFQAGLVNPDVIMHEELAYDWPYVINPDRCATGYLYVTCLHDVQDAQQRWYAEEVKKEDQVPMTVDVCYDFCHSIPGTQFFGLQNGNRCFCTPFFISGMPFFKDGRHESQAKWTGKGHFEAMCDMPCVGNSKMMCGGKKLADIYQLVDCREASATTTTTTNVCGHGHPIVINLEDGHLVMNNLGGAGPDDGPEEMKYTGIAEMGGSYVDLVVRAEGGYQPGIAVANGVSGPLGRVTVKDGTSVNLVFTFLHSASDTPIELPSFYFSLFDIDQSESGNETEAYTIGGFDQYSVAEDTEVEITATASGGAVFASTRFGQPCDDPVSPNELHQLTCEGNSVDQRKRVVTMHFSDTSTIEMSVSVPCFGDCLGFRTLIFAGTSGLVGHCGVTGTS